MPRLPILSALVLAMIAACTIAPPNQGAPVQAGTARPLETLPAHADMATVRDDLLTTATDRFGPGRLAEARNAETHLIVKRFAGMLPPPPPGESRRYTPRAALLARQAGGWMVAGESGWRAANAEAAAEIDRLLADRSFWDEPAYTPPCPDFGASLLLLKVPGRAETVRNSTCMSRASRLVEATLRA